jgi:hypothetical protein
MFFALRFSSTCLQASLFLGEVVNKKSFDIFALKVIRRTGTPGHIWKPTGTILLVDFEISIAHSTVHLWGLSNDFGRQSSVVRFAVSRYALFAHFAIEPLTLMLLIDNVIAMNAECRCFRLIIDCDHRSLSHEPLLEASTRSSKELILCKNGAQHACRRGHIR